MKKIIFLSEFNMNKDIDFLGPKLTLTFKEDDALKATITTYVNDETFINSKEITLSDLERNSVYSFRYGKDGFYPFEINDEYSINDTADEGFRIYISPDGQTMEMECFPDTKITNEENLEIKYTKCQNPNSRFRFRCYLADKYPDYKKNFDIIKDSMGEILDPKKSLSYLDAQVDIITKLLIEIIEPNIKNLKPETRKLYKEFKDIFEQTSLLNIVTNEKLKRKMRHKTTTRQYQLQRNEIMNDNN